MGKDQEVDGAVASTPRLLDDDRDGHQPLHRTTKQTHSKLERQGTAKNVWSYIQYSKELAKVGIQDDTTTHWLGQFS
jgi:hypothetical protein